MSDKKILKISTLFLVIALIFSCASMQKEKTIHEIVDEKDYDGLKNFMFGSVANINERDVAGRTPLQISVKNGTLDISKFLISQLGAKVDVTDNDGRTAIFYAAENSDIETLNYLTEQKANINVVNNKGNTLLHDMLITDNIPVIEFLIKNGALVNIPDVQGVSVLEYAVKKGKNLAGKIFTKENVNLQTREGKTALNCAVEIGESQVVALLLGLGADTRLGKCTGNYTNVDYAFKKGENINYAEIAIQLMKKGNYIPSSDYEYVETYVNSPNISGFYSQGGFPLHKAVEKGHKGFVEYFVGNKIDIDRYDAKGMTPLAIALLKNNFVIAKFLIENNADVNKSTPVGDTPLLLLLKNSKESDIARLLIAKGASINARNNYGDTPLLAAIENRYPIDLIKDLIVNDSDVNVRNNAGITPLHIAIKNDMKDVVELLTKRGALLHANDNEGKTPFLLALERGFEFSSWLVSKIDIKSRDDEGNTLLHLAVLKYANKDLIRLLIIKGVAVNQKNVNGDIPLHIALRIKYEEAAKILLEDGSSLFIENIKNETPVILVLGQKWATDDWIAHPRFLSARDAAGNTPLHFAISYNFIDAAGKLVKLNADLNGKNNLGQTPLHIAVEKNNKPMIEFLLKLGVDGSVRDNAGNSVYHYLVNNESIDLFPIFVSYKLDFNVANIYGKTPLHEAVSYKKNVIAKILLDQHASVSIRDNWGRQPIHDAAKVGNIIGVQMLINAGANVMERDNGGNTPLHHAVKENDEMVSKYLISLGADIYAVNKEKESPLSIAFNSVIVTSWFLDNALLNIVDNEGKTPLHLAVEFKKPLNILDIFIKKGADLDKKDMIGQTPLHIALNSNYEDAAKILVSAGASIFIRNKDGISPVEIGMNRGVLILDWLITIENLAKTDNQGNTPLHLAAIKKDGFLYDYLVKRGADVTVVNKDGYTALQLMKLR